SDLAMSLRKLTGKLVWLDLREEALAAAQEAVAIFRRLAGPRPDAFLPGLATSLYLLGRTFSDLGRRDEALTATRDGLDIRRRLAQVRPEKFLPDVASSLRNLGNDLAAFGQYDEAQSAMQEPVSIHRRLVKAQPKEFLPVLARDLGALGATVAGAGRHHDAATAFREGLAVLAPFLEDEGEAFRDLADGLLRNYVAACEKSGTPADETLLNAVSRALNREELKAKMRAVLNDANKSGHLDEAAVSTLPPARPKRLRDFWVTGQTKG